MGQLGLNLITGPANAGKVALLLRRYLEALDREPYLIVPNRSDVERVERDLLELQPALLGGSIGTFDDLGLWDRDLLRRHAAARVANELEAWSGEPVFAYGFEDLTGAEWALLQALAGRTEATVSIPYEPGRPAFASLGRTMDDLATLASGRIEELSP